MSVWTGKHIVITGATRGVGYESAKLFLDAGAEVFGTGKDPDRLAAVARELGNRGRFIPFAADWNDPAAPAAVAAAVGKTWTSVDVLANNAAVQTYKKSWFDEGLGLFEEQLRINVLAPHELIFRLTPLLERGTEPRVVNVGSGAGNRQSLQNQSDMPTYRLTKYTLGGLTMLWATELKGRVAVNCLDPGWLKTDLGGPNAPGEPSDGGRRMLEICSLPWTETGKFWYGDKEISY
jgi:NAD(P)-dependent dehydrogenase (short-subunit alcohol dehydrogenase family)